jgi:hypothetical protein
MTPSESQILLPLAIAIVIIALRARHMMRPRRLRLKALWIGPLLALAGGGAFLAIRPVPSIAHIAGMTVAFLLGCGLGVARARLEKLALDPETNRVTQSGTPFGILLLIGLLILRSGVRLVAIDHPELGIDLNGATDVLLFFAIGLLASYAVAVGVAVGRLRRTG